MLEDTSGGGILAGGRNFGDDLILGGRYLDGFGSKTTPKLLPEFASSSIDDVIGSSTRLKGQMPEGARGIAKKLGHAQRGGCTSAFDGVKPTQANATKIIRETLSNPSRSFYGNKVIDVYNGAGQGIRIDRQTNKCMGFLEGTLSTQ